ncbi:DUF5615 family PIN-like protein [Halosimplex halobium]|uniref:DUF5615 family PIN-like protein n=1 Tax=Halosimplex halobium TaxID=3396618 RepID=UPI003F559925
MRLALLLDENVEADLARKLARDGHDVERVVEVETLGVGTPDAEIRRYARETGRIVVTYDDHFADPDGDHAGVFYCPDQDLSPFEIFRIVSSITDHFDEPGSLPPVVYLTENWL